MLKSTPPAKAHGSWEPGATPGTPTYVSTPQELRTRVTSAIPLARGRITSAMLGPPAVAVAPRVVVPAGPPTRRPPVVGALASRGCIVQVAIVAEGSDPTLCGRSRWGATMLLMIFRSRVESCLRMRRLWRRPRRLRIRRPTGPLRSRGLRLLNSGPRGCGRRVCRCCRRCCRLGIPGPRGYGHGARRSCRHLGSPEPRGC